jgi:hypothetical protein
MAETVIRPRRVGPSTFFEIGGPQKESQWLAADHRLLLQPESVQIRDGHVYCTWGKRPRFVVAKASLWHDCAVLAKATPLDEKICRFVRKWGPLRGHDGSSEALSRWLEFSRFVRSVDRVCKEMGRGEVGAKEDWKEILHGHTPTLEVALVRSKPDATLRWVILSRAVNQWYSKCGNHSILGVVGGIARLEPHAAGVSGIVIIQLAQRVAKVLAVRVCAGCKRKLPLSVGPPSRGERRYCQGCRDKGRPVRDASRAYRVRQKQRELLEG